MGLLVLLGIDQLPEGEDPRDVGTALLAMSVFFLPIVLSSVFQVFARQSPVLKIYREGIKIRLLWTPIRYGVLLGCLLALCSPLALLLLACVTLWRLFTLQLFRIQTFHLRWENIVEIPAGKNEFTIVSWKETDSNNIEPNFNDVDDCKQKTSLELWQFPFDANSFGTSIRSVIEAVQCFERDPDLREMLPSWQDTDILFGNDAFDFPDNRQEFS